MFFLRSSRIRVVLQLYESIPTDKRERYDWRAEKNLDGNSCVYVCIEVALCGDAHGIGRSNWAKGRDPSGSWVQYPNPAVPLIPRRSRWIIQAH